MYALASLKKDTGMLAENFTCFINHIIAGEAMVKKEQVIFGVYKCSNLSLVAGVTGLPAFGGKSEPIC